jgi:hypothetical protein
MARRSLQFCRGLLPAFLSRSHTTWVEYSDDGLNRTDTQHAAKLEKMAEFAPKRKIKPLQLQHPADAQQGCTRLMLGDY